MAGPTAPTEEPAEPPRKTLGIFRFMLLLSSFCIVPYAWLIQGIPKVPSIEVNGYNIPGWAIVAFFVVGFTILPFAVVVLRWQTALRQKHYTTYTFERVEDDRSKVFDYLFAVLLTMLFIDVSSWRGLALGILALALILWLFTFLNLQHVNLPLAICRYRLYLAWPTGTVHPVVVLCKHGPPKTQKRLRLLRLDNHLFVET